MNGQVTNTFLKIGVNKFNWINFSNALFFWAFRNYFIQFKSVSNASIDKTGCLMIKSTK